MNHSLYEKQNNTLSPLTHFMKHICFKLACFVLSIFAINATASATPVCDTLYAGQSTNAGTVCIDNNFEYITVTYTTINGWKLDEVHLFLGATLAAMPQTKTGNPKIGHFPYTDDAAGSTSYTFKLPLGDFNARCGTQLTVAAHAAVSKLNSNGTLSNETAWRSGLRMVAKGNWAMYSSYTVQCPPPTACTRTETAFAYGDQTFFDLGLINDNRWGWQLTVNSFISGSTPIYAGAGQNDITKGTLVGTLNYLYGGGALYVNYQMNSPSYSLLATHLYAKDVNITKSAPGKYGNSHEALAAGTMSDTYNIQVPDTNGNGVIFVVAHAEVCFR